MISSEIFIRSMHVLYIAYWGACEPLGQSLIVPAVIQLARNGVRITLITFEKSEDLENDEFVRHVRESLSAVNIRWIPLRYHKRPKIPATLFDISHGWFRGLLEQSETRVDLIHARTYIGGLIGMSLSFFLRIPWVYHNEGFYPDEQVDGGVWKENSRVHRLARMLERRMYHLANGLIVLSYRAEDIVRQLPAVKCRRKPVAVVPSCVDLDRFHPSTAETESPNSCLQLVYIGSIGHRYLFARVARFAKIARNVFTNVRLKVLTRADATLVRDLLTKADFPKSDCRLDSVPHESMPEELVQHHAGMFFLTNGLSEHGCSPTKVGEYWACGIPAVVTGNVSDLDEIIRKYRVGVIISEHTDEAYHQAAIELQELLADSELSVRCRTAAERYYSLERGVSRQLHLYRQISVQK